METHLILDRFSISDRLAAKSQGLTALHEALAESDSTDPRIGRLVETTRTYAHALDLLSEDFKNDALPSVMLTLRVEDAALL